MRGRVATNQLRPAGLQSSMSRASRSTHFASSSLDFAVAADRTWEKASPESPTRTSIATASGFIAGEAIAAVIIPILVTAELMNLAG